MLRFLKFSLDQLDCENLLFDCLEIAFETLLKDELDLLSFPLEFETTESVCLDFSGEDDPNITEFFFNSGEFVN